MSENTNEQPNDAQQAPQPQQQAPEAKPEAPKPEPQESEADRIARLERELTAARAEAGKSRVNAKQQAAEAAQQETLNKVLAALGVQPDGSKQVTLDDVQAELQTQRTRADNLQRENALMRALSTLNAKPIARAAILGDNVLGGLDMNAPDYTQQVEAAVKAYIDSNPDLSAAQAARKNGVEMPGGSGEGAITQERFNAMSGGERNQLYLTNPTLYARLSGRE